jgi:hypothetical protein
VRKQKPVPDAPPAPPQLLDRAWVYAIVAAWVLGLVAWYYRLQFVRLRDLAR